MKTFFVFNASYRSTSKEYRLVSARWKPCLTYTNPGFRLPSLKSPLDLVYPGQNRENQRNLKESDWLLKRLETKKERFFTKIKAPDWCIITINKERTLR